MSVLTEKVKKILSCRVTDDPGIMEEFSHDASLFEVVPSLAVFPENVSDIQKLVDFVRSENNKGEKLSLTPRSAGTDMTGGPLSESIVVDMTSHLNSFKEIGPDYAVAEPGMFYRDFEKETLKKGLLLPSYPASRELCTIGGMVSNNSGGERTLSYGKTENYVEEVFVVLSDGSQAIFKKISKEELADKKKLQNFEGEIYRRMAELIDKNFELIANAKPDVSKNSAGYNLWNVCDKKAETFDLAKLVVGSQGTLGIITKIKFRLVVPKKHSRMLIVFLRDIPSVGSLARHIMQFKPESFESYDDHTFSIAVKVFPELIRKLRGGLIKLFFSFLPEFWAVLTGGIPKLVVLAEFTGDTAGEAEQKALMAEASLKGMNLKTKVTRSAEAGEKYWVIRRESFNLLRKKIKGLRTAPFIDDIVVRMEKLPEFLPRLYDILNQYEMVYTIAGHVGDGNFHIIPLLDFKIQKSRDVVFELADKVYGLVIEFGGSITGEHNDGLMRSPFLEKMYGHEVYKLFEETKQIFDPMNIFNPGKKVGSSAKYSVDHIVKK